MRANCHSTYIHLSFLSVAFVQCKINSKPVLYSSKSALYPSHSCFFFLPRISVNWIEKRRLTTSFNFNFYGFSASQHPFSTVVFNTFHMSSSFRIWQPTLIPPQGAYLFQFPQFRDTAERQGRVCVCVCISVFLCTSLSESSQSDMKL